MHPKIRKTFSPSILVVAVSEVRFEGGSARASITRPGWEADRAFILGYANGWYNNGQIFPNIIWYEFPKGKRFVPARVSFRGRQDSIVDQAPAMWQFVGSNDETCDRFSKWTVLCQDLSKEKYPHKKWTKYCEVDEKIFCEFKCLGISVLNSHNKDGYAALKDVRMWKRAYQ